MTTASRAKRNARRRARSKYRVLPLSGVTVHARPGFTAAELRLLALSDALTDWRGGVVTGNRWHRDTRG